MDGDNFCIQEEKMSTISRIARPSLARRPATASRRPAGSTWRSFVGLAGSIAIGVADLLFLWQQRLRDRDMLRQMTTAQLKDIGVSRADALQEAGKPFWRG
jgi:uncharacterized protein YjiS (DUF1127 family)